MGPGTDFDGICKADAEAYERAVAFFLRSLDAYAGADLFEAVLESVVYDGDGDTYGTSEGETLTLTFSSDVEIPVGQEKSQAMVYFAESTSLGHNADYIVYTVEDNAVIITVVEGGTFGNPRPEIGDLAVRLDGIVDLLGNPVVVSEDGVEVNR